MNGVQTRFKCKLDVKRWKRFVFPPSSLLPRSNALKTKAIRYFQTDQTLTRIVSSPLHAAESTFWDVLKYSKAPVIVSHSSASAIYRHDRNLTDEQLRALAAHGGVAQACLVDEFLNPDAKKTNLTDFMKHLLHMVEVAGIDHVGIGSDFDGGGGVKGCNGDNDFINITVRLLEHGFTETDIAKIWGGNFLRVMKQVQTK